MQKIKKLTNMVTKKQIKKFLQQHCEYLAKSDEGCCAYYRIDTRDKKHINLYDEIPDLKIIVAWSEGFDVEYEKDNPFVDDRGFGLCVSLRVNDNQMFEDDSYFVDDDYALTQGDIEDGFEASADCMFKQIVRYVELWHDKEYYCPIHECRLYPAYWSDDESGYMYCPTCCNLIKIEHALYRKDEECDKEEE